MSASVYIGAEVIVSPLGIGAQVNIEKMLAGESGILKYPCAGWKNSDVWLSKISGLPENDRFATLLKVGMEAVLSQLDTSIITSADTLVIVSSTKGNVSEEIRAPFERTIGDLSRQYSLKNTPLVISNACISGILAINLAAELLKNKAYKHVVVLGCDVLSDFILYGFQALYAVSDSPCRPFDAGRKGISLGEGCGAVVLSVENSIFAESPNLFLGGADANDANHISGPSRTGEGLVRAIDKALLKADVSPAEVGFINAHGTGTVFNDEMESIAFKRLGLTEVPLNSLKGYWGHTLGAAGVMETAACLQSLKTGRLCSSIGFEQQGTSEKLNVLVGNEPLKSDVILKTASGFGGGNAALLLRKI